MTGFQLVYSLGILLAIVATAWFSIRVVADTIKVDGLAGIWHAFRFAGLKPFDVLDIGKLAYCCHRISGLAIFVFLCLHILNVSLHSWSSQLFDEVHVLYTGMPARILECGLLLAILFHSLNGLRLLVLDFSDVKPKTAQRLLKMVFWLSLALAAGGSAVILAPVLS
jgi:succinate dehydrogenase / fumarate reductase cytochrome b subunit